MLYAYHPLHWLVWVLLSGSCIISDNLRQLSCWIIWNRRRIDALFLFKIICFCIWNNRVTLYFATETFSFSWVKVKVACRVNWIEPCPLWPVTTTLLNPLQWLEMEWNFSCNTKLGFRASLHSHWEMCWILNRVQSRPPQCGKSAHYPVLAV